MTEHELLKARWEEIVQRLSDTFTEGETLNVDGIIYLIGVQELGQIGRSYAKDEKVDLMHIAICKVLEPFGYYKYEFTDPDGWPHYLRIIVTIIEHHVYPSSQTWRTNHTDEKSHRPILFG